MEGEEDNVCGGLAESEPVGIAGLYDSPVGAKRQGKLRQEDGLATVTFDIWHIRRSESEKDGGVFAELPQCHVHIKAMTQSWPVNTATPNPTPYFSFTWVCSIGESVPYSLPSRHSEGIGWARTETGLHPSRGYMETDGHADLQHVALVDPQRQFSGMDYMSEGTKLYKDMDRLTAFYKGLSTWASWVDLNIDPSKTKVFFQGISPTHYMGKEWNSQSKNCYGELEPLSGPTYPAGAPAAAAIVNQVLSKIRKPVYLLDITTLSQLRKDAHPSAYGEDRTGMDCSHWCLPGLPDTWNQLLYAALVMGT
ncbi:Protein trichome birefringence-like 38 [Vitis vinifera]|uniref:Protein trichome birefringence-like 38 n=1 Tax=Vitis vinifera TaxID=29760 RepID=A0A438CRA1_VITVI|nr:Protein trichome birefringence-like 38 [Vitis vinifera]